MGFFQELTVGDREYSETKSVVKANGDSKAAFIGNAIILRYENYKGACVTVKLFFFPASAVHSFGACCKREACAAGFVHS